MADEKREDIDQENNEENDLIPDDAYSQEIGTDLDDETPDKPKGMPLHTKILIGLVLGVVAGLIANRAFVEEKRVETKQPDGSSIIRTIEEDSSGIETITVIQKQPDTVVDGVVAEKGEEKVISVEGRRGVPWVVANFTRPIGQLFLNLLLMIVVPLVFSSLIVGVAGIGDIRKLGRIGAKSFGYTLVISAISVAIGLTLANTIRPGERVDPETRAKLEDKYKSSAEDRVESQKKADAAATDTPLMSVVKTIVPKNVFNSISGPNPNMLHIMFFALIVGIAITLIPSPITAPFVGFMESLFTITAKIIDIIMKFAPYAVACLLFNNIALFGVDLLKSLFWFVLTVLLGLGIHFFVIYSISIQFLSKINPLEFFKRVRTVILTAFSTSSSNATLPTALRVSEENLGVPKEINSFVLTVGATANQNGTALYEGVTVLFIAQLAGFDLTFAQQLMIVYLAILGGIGTAGVPSGSIPFIIGILAMIGIDPALIAIIIGVDRILDMCRTTLNVVGDITAATYVARSEGYNLLRHAKISDVK